MKKITSIPPNSKKKIATNVSRNGNICLKENEYSHRRGERKCNLPKSWILRCICGSLSCSLTRALLEVAFERPLPLRLSRIAKIGGAARRRVFTYLTRVFRNSCKNFDPRSCKVSSPGQVKCATATAFQTRHGYNVLGKVMKLSEYDKVINAYKTYISDFFISVTSGQVIFAISPL